MRAEELDLARAAVPLEDGCARLLERIGGARFVLLGTATHGTHELALVRARITRRLVAEKGFDAVTVEEGWTEAYRVQRFIRGRSSDLGPEEALASFTRFPRWLCQNTVVRDFVDWARRTAPHIGVCGLDLYGIHASIDAVLRGLEQSDPETARRARSRYACFDPFGPDTSTYALASASGKKSACEDAVTQQVLEVQRDLAAAERSHREGAGIDAAALETSFQVDTNARLVRHAEKYYRSMLVDPVIAWNLRDRHMADMLASVVQHLNHRLRRLCKIVVWTHLAHAGDARATELGKFGRTSFGQLLRERYDRDVFTVGLTTYEGAVTAALDWGEEPVCMPLRPAVAGSHELLLHATGERIGAADLVVLPDEERRLHHALVHERLERMIGVGYPPGCRGAGRVGPREACRAARRRRPSTGRRRSCRSSPQCRSSSRAGRCLRRIRSRSDSRASSR